MILGLFLYVGAEVGVNSWIATFLNQKFQFDLGSLATGGIAFFFVGPLDRPPHRLRGAELHVRPPVPPGDAPALSVLGTLGIMLGSKEVAVASIFVTGLGFGNVFPLIFSILIDRMPERSAELSGLLCMAIAGGAVMPLVMGAVGDAFGSVDRRHGGAVRLVPLHPLPGRARGARGEGLGRPAMSYASDPRVVLTLDAGGTNFAFSAVRGDREVVEPVTLPSNAHDLKLCLETIVEGFAKVKEKAPAPPVAISFAFPGPADYPNGIIGDLGNLPAFKGGGIALGPMLEDRFGVPVFMNNDGDLFAFGEAIAGFLPWVNGLLAEGGSPKRFRNLFGATFGTGFGGGIVQDGRLWIGDNSAGGEIWLFRNKLDPRSNIEEAVSIRAIRRVYAREGRDRLRDGAGAEGHLRDRQGREARQPRGGASRPSGGWARRRATRSPRRSRSSTASW